MARTILVLLSVCSVCAPLVAQTAPRPLRPPISATFKVPDSMRVSLGNTPINARIPDAVTVKLADRPPWWESNTFSAFGGALLGGLLVIIGEAARARLRRGGQHRTSLARLERVCVDYLNEILTNRRLARDAFMASAATALYWHLPNPFEIDRSFATDIMDLDTNKLTAAMNTDLLRYNYDIAKLGRARDALQTAHLADTLPLPVWQEAMRLEAPKWQRIATHLGIVDDLVRDVQVRAVLLVYQYDSRRVAPALFRARHLSHLVVGRISCCHHQTGA